MVLVADLCPFFLFLDDDDGGDGDDDDKKEDSDRADESTSAPSGRLLGWAEAEE